MPSSCRVALFGMIEASLVYALLVSCGALCMPSVCHVVLFGMIEAFLVYALFVSCGALCMHSVCHVVLFGMIGASLVNACLYFWDDLHKEQERATTTCGPRGNPCHRGP